MQCACSCQVSGNIYLLQKHPWSEHGHRGTMVKGWITRRFQKSYQLSMMTYGYLKAQLQNGTPQSPLPPYLKSFYIWEGYILFCSRLLACHVTYQGLSFSLPARWVALYAVETVLTLESWSCFP